MKKGNKIVYSEPADYFPRDIRKKFGLGEYAGTGTSSGNKKAPAKTKTTTKKVKRGK